MTGILQPEADTGWTRLPETVFIAVQVPDGTVAVQIYYAESGSEATEHLIFESKYSNSYHHQAAAAKHPTGCTWRASDDYPISFLGHIGAVTTDADGKEHSSVSVSDKMNKSGN